MTVGGRRCRIVETTQGSIIEAITWSAQRHHRFRRMQAISLLLLVLVVWLVEAVEKESNTNIDDEPPPNFNMNDFAQQQNCPNYRCSSGMTPVPKTRLKFTSTGCSAMGGGMVLMGNQNEKEDEPYASCCDEWHACYQVCGIAKKICDDSFKSCAAIKCGSDEDCTKQVELSTMMMNLSGCHRFDQAQYQACECVLKNKATEKRQAAIRRFYNKFAPSAETKADELAKKVDKSTAKMAGLFRKLLSKYPDAIQKVEDPQQAMYRKMMEEAKNKDSKDDISEEEKSIGDDEDREEVQEL